MDTGNTAVHLVAMGQWGNLSYVASLELLGGRTRGRRLMGVASQSLPRFLIIAKYVDK